MNKQQNEKSNIDGQNLNEQQQTDLNEEITQKRLEQVSFTIGGKNYSYNGPTNEQTQELLDILAGMERKEKIQTEQLILSLYNSINQLLLKNYSLFGDKVKIEIADVCTHIIYWSIYLAVLFESISIKNKHINTVDSPRTEIASYLPLFCFLYTLGSLICQNITNIYIWIFLFLGLLITPLFVMLNNLNIFNNYEVLDYNYYGIGLCLISILIFAHSAINGYLLQYVKQITSKLFALIFNLSFCLLISYLIVFKIITFLILIESFNSIYIINSIKDIIAVPLLLELLLLSVILLVGIFRVTPSQIQADLKRLNDKKEIDGEIQGQNPHHPLENEIVKAIKKLKLQILSPLLVSIWYITLQIFSYYGLIHEMSQSYIDYQKLITFSVLLSTIPIYFTIGICISNSNIRISNLYLWIPLLIAGACFGTTNIQNLISQYEQTFYSQRLVGISPLLIGLIWLTVGYFRQERRHQRLLLMLICCYFFAFPLGFLLPISEIFQDFRITISALILILIGFFLLALVILYYIFVVLIYLYDIPSQAQRSNFYAYQLINIISYAHWVNSILFIIGAHCLSYCFWNESETTTQTKKGTIQGLLLVHSLLFIMINYALRIQMQKQLSFEKEFYKIVQNKQEERKNQIIWTGVFLSFTILLPVSLTRENQTQKTAILVLAFAIPIIFLYLRFLNFVKQNSGIYQNFWQPFVIIFMWFFIMGPVGIMFPVIAYIYDSHSREFAAFVQVAVAYTILVTILTVTLVFIFFFVIKENGQLEQKMDVLKRVMQLLANHGVKSTVDVCLLILTRYIQKQDRIQLKQELLQGSLVNLIKYSEGYFNLMLVTEHDCKEWEKYQILKKQQTYQIILFQNQIYPGFLKTLLKFFYDCFFCRYGTDESKKNAILKRQMIIDLNELQQRAILNQIQNSQQPSENFLQRLKMDDFYMRLLYNNQRTETFWCGVHSRFYDNFQIIVHYLGFIIDEQILSQYQSYEKINQSQIRLSLTDFAEFMKDNLPLHDGPYQQLWCMARQKYPIFIYNFPDLWQFMKIKCHDTPFSIKNYEQSSYLKYRSRLRSMVEIGEESIEKVFKDYQMGITERYKSQLPNCFQKKIWEMCQCVHHCLGFTSLKFNQKYNDKFIQPIIHRIPPIVPDDINHIVRGVEWETLSQIVGDCVVESYQTYDKRIIQQGNRFNITKTNLFVVTLRLYDFYSLSTFAFSSQVGWFDKQEFNPIQFVDYSAIWNNFNLFFALALFLSCLNILFGLKIKFSKKQLAQNKKYIRTIELINSQFIFIIKSYIDVFICNYGEYPYKLVRLAAVECWSDLHFMYAVLALIGFFLYFPFSTLISAYFQYFDDSLDLKYSSSYVVLYIQAKLLILGLTSVFYNLKEEAYIYQMLFSSIVIAFLIYGCHRLEPCFIKWFNYIEIFFLFLLCFIYFAAFLIMITNSRLVGGIFLAITGFMSFIFHGYKLYKYYYNHRDVRSARITPVQNDEVMRIEQV